MKKQRSGTEKFPTVFAVLARRLPSKRAWRRGSLNRPGCWMLLAPNLLYLLYNIAADLSIGFCGLQNKTAKNKPRRFISMLLDAFSVISQKKNAACAENVTISEQFLCKRLELCGAVRVQGGADRYRCIGEGDPLALLERRLDVLCRGGRP